MALSFKVRLLNLFRNFFRIPPIEAALASLTTGKAPDSFISKFVPNPYQYRKETFRIMERDGIKMKLDISDYVGHYVYFGFKESSMEDLFALCMPGANVLDIGTNIGWTLQNLAKRSGTGIVFGFEPDPYNYVRCNENVSLNNFENVTVFPIGLSDVNAQLTMEMRTPSNRGGNRIATTGTGYAVDVVRLDDFEPVTKLTRVDVIKIDVEGYELHVLKGAEVTLRKYLPALFIEVDDNNLRDQGSSAEKLIRFLIDIGYSRITGADNGVVVKITDSFSNCHFDIIALK